MNIVYMYGRITAFNQPPRQPPPKCLLHHRKRRPAAAAPPHQTLVAAPRRQRLLLLQRSVTMLQMKVLAEVIPTRLVVRRRVGLDPCVGVSICSASCAAHSISTAFEAVAGRWARRAHTAVVVRDQQGARVSYILAAQIA